MAIHDYFQKNYFKPLSHFFETRQKTHARTRRNTFGQKFMDTWQMWSGTPSIQRRHLAAKAGLLDYSMLLLPAIIGFIKAVLFDLFLSTIGRPRWLVPFLIFLGPILLVTSVIDFVFDVIKQTIGLFITLASTLFIAIVHGITLLATQQEKKALVQEIDKLFNGDEDNPEIPIKKTDVPVETSEREDKMQFEPEKIEMNRPGIVQKTKLPGSKMITNVQLIKKENDNEHVYLQFNKTCEIKANKLVQMADSELTNKNKYIKNYPTYILTETALYYKRSRRIKSIIITNDEEKIKSLNNLFSCYLVKMSDTAFQQDIKQPIIQLVKMSTEELNKIKTTPETPRYILTDEELCYQGVNDKQPKQILCIQIDWHNPLLEGLQKYFEDSDNNIDLSQAQLEKIKSLAPRTLDTIMDSPQYLLTDKAFYYKNEANTQFTKITDNQEIIQTLQQYFQNTNQAFRCLSNEELQEITQQTQHQHIKVFEKLSKKQSDLIHLQTDLVNDRLEKKYTIEQFKNSPYYFFNYGHHDKDKTKGAAEQFEDLFPDL